MVQAKAVRLSKLSDSKYEIILTTPNARKFCIELRTSRTGSIEFKRSTNENLALLNIVSYNETIVSFEAPCCIFHLENLDRGHYFLELTLGNGEHFRFDFITKGYIKATFAERSKEPNSLKETS